MCVCVCVRVQAPCAEDRMEEPSPYPTRVVSSVDVQRRIGARPFFLYLGLPFAPRYFSSEGLLRGHPTQVTGKGNARPPRGSPLVIIIVGVRKE